ncbi:hypothetical protein DFAR_2810008 [Desulfarculales bacterium]
MTLLEPYKGTPTRHICEQGGLDQSYEVSGVPRVLGTPRGISQAELKGLFRTSPLYVKMPSVRWSEIERAESGDQGLVTECSHLK